jgi:polysaccharide biosynthesis PFTS motif protein
MARATLQKLSARVFGRYGRTMARRSLRGYRRLVERGELARVAEACKKLSWTPLAGGAFFASKTLFGAASEHADLAARQFLCIRLIMYRFTPVLLAQADGRNIPLKYPLPPQWQRVVEANGFAVNRPICTALWVGFMILAWGYGVATTVRLAFGAFLPLRGDADMGPFVHFENLDRPNLPQGAASYDPMSWYLQLPLRAHGVGALTHRVKGVAPYTTRGVSVRPLAHPYLARLSPSLFLSYGLWGASAAGISLLQALRGRWWHALLLGECAHAALVRLSPRERLAHDYLFNNSNWLYRPLWTYEAQGRGSRILFYHYSSNLEGFKRRDGYRPHFTFAMMSWPHHLVWDEAQADFIRRNQQRPATAEVVGPVWFADSSEPMPPVGAGAVAIFDVPMFRTALLPVIAEDDIYYTPETCSAFLRDASAACRANGVPMVWKRKRAIGKMAHAEYRELISRLDKYGDVLLVPPSISAFRVIEACAMVISMPFTSTALIGRHLHKPSCYYDPSGKLFRDDRGAHGIPILQTREELAAWIGAHAPPGLHRRPTVSIDSAT